ncbi:hypothetical protein BJ165DRAFT_1533196 [Panaeolus papilionaceus]|nr:hypothetical protein BJ165DRAFT_1533196 [Panaeolus papilionaceus]
MDEQYNGGVGLANPNLGIGRRKMLDLANKLHSTGVQVDIDLPQIAVIGSQSAGKSSLIQSISCITLPRESGTCTRVPTECRLSRSDSRWQCTVSLRFITDKRGNICDTSQQNAPNLPFLEMENKPFSLNTHYLEDYKNKFLTHYRAARQKYQQSNLLTQIQMLQNMRSTPALAQETRKIATNKRAESDPRAVTAPPQPTGLEKVLIGLAEMGMHGMKPEDLLRLVPPDAMDPLFAYKRFADNVPIAVDLELVRAAEKRKDIKLSINSP